MPRRTFLLVVCLALVPYAWLTHRFDWVCDDAFISFRYSQHLAAGHGLRFNIGEQPPVEGYSNFLWVLALTPFEAAGWPAAGPARLLSVACGLILLLRLATHLARRLKPSALAAVLLVYTTLPAVALWSTSGLETMAFALLVFLAFENLGRHGRMLPAALASIGLVLIRAEGFAWAWVLMALAALEALIARDRSQVRPLLFTAAATTTAALALLMFRLTYFGYPLPNTAYAKVGLSLLSLERGGRYAASFLLTFPHLVVILLAGLALALTDRSARATLRHPLLIVGAFFAYAVAVGGDFMPMGRMLVPALPFLALVLGPLMANVEVWRASGTPLVPLVLVCIACSMAPAFDLHPVPREVRRQLNFRWNIKKFDSEYRQWRRMRKRVTLGEELGRALTAHTQPGESLPYGRIGAVAYFSHLFILDQNGLVNLEVARGEVQQLRSAGHDKTVPLQFFLKDRPDYYRAKVVNRPAADPRLKQTAEALMSDLPVAERGNYTAEIIPLEPRAGKPGSPKRGHTERALLLAKRKGASP